MAQADDLAKLMDAHWSAVVKLLHALCRNHHDTEDLAQETFCRAFDRLASLRPQTNARAWLLRIATNLYFDQHRARKRRPVLPLTRDVAEPTQASSPLEIGEEAARLRDAVGQLSELTRAVFHLRAAEDLPFRDIADMIGISEESARWHMFQARRRLVELLVR